MSTATQAQAATEARQKRNFDVRERPVQQAITLGTHMYVRKEYINPQKERKHNISPIAEGPCEVLDANADAVVVKDGSLGTVLFSPCHQQTVTARPIHRPASRLPHCGNDSVADCLTFHLM